MRDFSAKDRILVGRPENGGSGPCPKNRLASQFCASVLVLKGNPAEIWA